MDSFNVKEFCQKLPKVELHAHLNTSYSVKSIQELIQLNGNAGELEEVNIATNQDIDESFKFFTKIQQLVKTEEAVYLLTRSVIEEFAADNVKYLELRSTPKDIPETGMTRELYMNTMIRAVKECQDKGLDIIVRLLVSFDRRHGIDIAKLTVELAEKLMKDHGGLINGIDLSGDPKVGDATDLIPYLIEAGKKNLKLALHLAELPSHAETKNVLCALCQEGSLSLRIGHGTFLYRHEDGLGCDEMRDLVLQKKIPIEACITSNLKTKTVSSIESHHFKYWFQQGHPVILCTDGKGVYDSTLSEEYWKAAQAFSLSREQLKDCVHKAIDSIFAEDSVKEVLRQKLNEFHI